eukprot:CAMPEP_0206245890 /NCGR_PEP_ID=MMETSP0047_2-20121206/18946_1 /ASSEMBLY_ACC=CAM_ASM_000192 /TAXON_ID=195065 /ORGANISM="Chroomonas mesostigmatica_cf, Strain CCMP1168" /LENGTH=508 /DNA_ID=CAMNT_0053671235 /DNA_START=51 /DNA_END=1575 /DNA_ORIENTATION=+
MDDYLIPEHSNISLSHGHEMLIPRSVMLDVHSAGDFASDDFQLDGVFAVTEEGNHSLHPVPVRPGFEWRMYGTPNIGIKWRLVPVDASQVFEGKLEPQTLLKQERMTRRAYDAYGRDVAKQEVLHEDEFFTHTGDMGLEQTRRLRGGDLEQLTSEDEVRQDNAKVIQGALRRSLITPLYPWLHISRLVSMERKKSKKERHRHGMPATMDVLLSADPPPQLPWCRCWMSLEPTHQLDSKSFDAMQQVVFDFEDNQLDTCLRRIDNIVQWRQRVWKKQKRRGSGGESRTDKVLVELAALCNRFGLKLYFMGRLESSHAFYTRVLKYTRMDSGVESGHNPELFSWTCDLVAFCLWHQGKYEDAHFALSRAAHPTVPTNMRMVSHLHAAQILLQQNKTDLVLKLTSTLLFELLQERREHVLEVQQGVDGEGDAVRGVLEIIEFKHEQSQQPSAPAYVNLLCHTAQTTAYALAAKGRFRDAATVTQAVALQTRDASGVSRDLKECVAKFSEWL